MQHSPITFFTPKPLLPPNTWSRKLEKQYEKRFKTNVFMKISRERKNLSFTFIVYSGSTAAPRKASCSAPLLASFRKALINT